MDDVGRTFEGIDDPLRAWIAAQSLFFAGTAPDVMKSHGTNWEKPGWIAAEKAYAAGDKVGASFGAAVQGAHSEDGEGHSEGHSEGSADGHEGAGH